MMTSKCRRMWIQKIWLEKNSNLLESPSSEKNLVAMLPYFLAKNFTGSWIHSTELTITYAISHALVYRWV